MPVIRVVWVHSFSTYARTCSYQGVRNVNFSENFVYVLNGWSLSKLKKKAKNKNEKEHSSQQWASLCSIQKNILYKSKEVAKIVQNNINQQNPAWFQKSQPQPQLKKLSQNFLWMRHWRCRLLNLFSKNKIEKM